jgi:signal transduction histidine kinase
MEAKDLGQKSDKDIKENTRSKKQSSFFLGLSIRKGLPLLMALLLLVVIGAATIAAYVGVRNSSLEAGRERLLSLTQQLVGLSQQSSANQINRLSVAANDGVTKSYLRASSPEGRAATLALLQQFVGPQDPANLQIDLLTADESVLVTLPEGTAPLAEKLQPDLRRSAIEPFKTIGTLRMFNDTIVYPLVVSVRDDDGKVLGYLVRWRKISATPEARKQLTDLLGSQAALYLGNTQGDLWTDMSGVVSKPPVDFGPDSEVAYYQRGGNSVMAVGRPIPGSPWLVAVEFPEQVFLTQARKFLRRMLIMGLMLLIAGIAAAYVVSRRITFPLHSLTEAASAISGGEVFEKVNISRSDELGELASAFNTMAARVRDSHHELEDRVRQRTIQLEEANNELESFSYSVSHDLRAPLRAISGFSAILLEDYADKMPDGARGHLEKVRDGAKTMGRLVDDLLNFSRLGRQALRKTTVAPADVARQVVSELSVEGQRPELTITIDDVPTAYADPSLLKHVYSNLISNAVKYSRDRSDANVKIGALDQNGHAETVYFVRDNGAGFDMQYADKLFGVFQRLHRADEFEGTGVGLAISQRIIHRHGGRIWAEAEVDAGATFFFTLQEGTDNDREHSGNLTG